MHETNFAFERDTDGLSPSVSEKTAPLPLLLEMDVKVQESAAVLAVVPSPHGTVLIVIASETPGAMFRSGDALRVMEVKHTPLRTSLPAVESTKAEESSEESPSKSIRSRVSVASFGII